MGGTNLTRMKYSTIIEDNYYEDYLIETKAYIKKYAEIHNYIVEDDFSPLLAIKFIEMIKDIPFDKKYEHQYLRIVGYIMVEQGCYHGYQLYPKIEVSTYEIDIEDCIDKERPQINEQLKLNMDVENDNEEFYLQTGISKEFFKTNITPEVEALKEFFISIFKK